MIVSNFLLNFASMAMTFASPEIVLNDTSTEPNFAQKNPRERARGARFSGVGFNYSLNYYELLGSKF